MDRTHDEIVAALQEHRRRDGGPNFMTASMALGVSRTTLQNYAKKHNLYDPLKLEPETPPQKAESLSPTSKLFVTGESTLYDRDGEVAAKWVKTNAGKAPIVLDAIKAELREFKGQSLIFPPSSPSFDSDTLTVYNLGDHHTGAYSWKDETGNDYDLEIAERILNESIDELVSRSPASHEALVLGLGDFFHADNSRNMTEKSGNVLDVDTRWCKVFRVGVSMAIRYVYAALNKHKRVTVRFLQGNHDPQSSIALSIAVAMHFDNNPRVNVDISPAKHFMMTFGKVLIAATHGDEIKPDQMAGFVAARWPVEWGKTEHRYAYFGHVHHKSKGGGEGSGLLWETFQVLAAKDSWHAGKGYSAGRSMTSVTHHKEQGEVSRAVVSYTEKRTPPKPPADDWISAVCY